MIKREVGKVLKNNISLIEYENDDSVMGATYFMQVGVVGLYCTKKELQDLYCVLNYYSNIEDFSQCVIKVGDEDVAIR